MSRPGDRIIERSGETSETGETGLTEESVKGKRGPILTVASDKSIYDEKSSRTTYKCLRASQWIVRILSFVLVLSCLVASRVSFAIMVEQFNRSNTSTKNTKTKDTKSGSSTEYTKEGLFWLLLFVVLIPYAFNFLRCVWCGLFSKVRKNYPWPTRRSIVAGFFTSTTECLCVVIFVFGVAPQITSSALTITMSCGVFLATIIYQIKILFRKDSDRNQDIENQKGYLRYHTRQAFYKAKAEEKQLLRRRRQRRQSDAEEAESLVTSTTSMSQDDNLNALSKGWRKFVGNTKIRKVAMIIALVLQIASFVLIIGDLIWLEASFITKEHKTTFALIPILLILLSVIWCFPVQKYLNIPQPMPPAGDDRPVASARWKAGILNGLWRLLFTPAFAVATVAVIAKVDKGQKSVIDIYSLRDGFNNMTDNWKYLGPFVVNVCSTLGAYLLAWLACTMKMHKAGFFLPLILSTPISVSLVLVPCQFKSVSFFKDITTLPASPYLACDISKNFNGILGALICLWLVQLIICIFYVYRAKLIALIREEELFIQSYYNGPFIEQCLILNRNTEVEDKKLIDPSKYSRQARVFICTTMYRESLKEQRQLLKSIYSVASEQSLLPKASRRHFESHIFFDGGANGEHPSQSAFQLISLLHETLHVDMDTMEKYVTEYGLQLRLNITEDFPFYIHLKDPNKYKKKKRWSQVMYMSYILDHRCEQDGLEDDNTFILTTDADIDFDRQAVEILIDRLARDRQVGAVCGRTHPIGDGPVVWYQKFDYAIGHWFQKVAEHVLGSVMCCPGCFSIFRLRALRPVLADYSSRVEQGTDFLKKDMGEDRWLCTLMVYAGWRLEYAAAADCRTYCPEEFDEFFKQRRRWIPSTMANLCELCARGASVISSNDAVSIFFIIYQAAMIFSTIINPGTVILIMAAGLQYAFAATANSLAVFYTSLAIFSAACIFYGFVNVYCREETKLYVGKVLTFIFSLIMAAVIVGVVVQVASGFEFEPKPSPTIDPMRIIPPPLKPTQHHTAKPKAAVANVLFEFVTSIPTNMTPTQHVNNLPNVPVSTWYLGALIAMYLIVAVIHPLEMVCIVHGLWYLFCLPAGYVLLIIYSVCNLNNRSWGTREGKTVTNEGKTLTKIFESWWDWLKEAFDCFICCVKKRVDYMVDEKKGGGEKEKESGSSSDKNDSKEYDHDKDEYVSRRKEYPDGVERIETFLEKIHLGKYVKDFQRHGYDDTSFLIKINDEELENLGVSVRGHRERIIDEIKILPDELAAPVVPDNVEQWLELLGLSCYVEEFANAGYEGEADIQRLIRLKEDDLRQEIKIKKRGHLKKVLQGIRKIQFPRELDKRIEGAMKKYGEVPLSQLSEKDEKESEFWLNLKNTRLKTEPEIYDQVDELKEKLDQLRNYWMLIFLVLNTIWILLIVLLQAHPELNVPNTGTNALGLVFLIVYGFILALQFLTCIWHRFETMVHYLARRPPETINLINPSMTADDVDWLPDQDVVRDYFPLSQDEEDDEEEEEEEGDRELEMLAKNGRRSIQNH